MKATEPPAIPWIHRHQALPPAAAAWGPEMPVPGLLAASEDINASRLIDAYRQGVFPWYSEGQPVLWWSPSPRMVLAVASFRFHRSLRKWIQAGLGSGQLSIAFDRDFRSVIERCSSVSRPGQSGSWITPELIEAYTDLHRLGHAHSIETLWEGEPIGGLYCVNFGTMVYGESMYALQPNASKVALTALVAFCALHKMDTIDCQQETEHLAYMGATPILATDFLSMVEQRVDQKSPTWEFNSQMWQSWDSRLSV